MHLKSEVMTMVAWLTQQVFWLQILVIIGAMLLAIGLL